MANSVQANNLEEPPDIDIFGEGGILARIRDFLFSAILVVATIFIIIAGYFFVTAQGEPEKIQKAKDMLLYALIGLLVAFCARGLVDLIKKMVAPPSEGLLPTIIIYNIIKKWMLL